MFASEGRAAGLLRGSELHELYPGEVGVEEVELDLAIAANLALCAVSPFAVIVAEDADGVFHADYTEGEVVHNTDMLKGGVWAIVEHVFEPVRAIRDLDADPVVHIGLGPAMPIGAEAENLLPESVLFGTVGDHEADVDDASAGGVG